MTNEEEKNYLVYKRVLQEIITEAGGKIKVEITRLRNDDCKITHHTELKDNRAFVNLKIENND